MDDFHKKFWDERAAKPPECVIDGFTYTIGDEKRGGTSHSGMSGRRFEIEFFDGRKVITTNLWAGGEVPPEYQDRIPNTARFLGGARRVIVGGITCFEPSTHT